MKTMIAVLLCATALGGCEVQGHFESKPVQPSKDYSQVWIDAGGEGGTNAFGHSNYRSLGHEWDFECLATVKLDDAQMTKLPNEPFHLWSRGGDYGEYDTLEHAKVAGERIVRKRELECAARAPEPREER